jgi:hypothetical protein
VRDTRREAYRVPCGDPLHSVPDGSRKAAKIVRVGYDWPIHQEKRRALGCGVLFVDNDIHV